MAIGSPASNSTRMDEQTADAVSITGGSINGAVIGGSAAGAGTFTTIAVTGNALLAGSISLGTPANHAVATCKIPLALSTTATVASVNYVAAVPAGSTIVAVDVITTTTFGAATDSKFQLGSSVGGSDYVASTTVSLAGGHHMTITATNNTAAPLIASVPALDASGNNLYGAIVMTGTGSTLGGATALVTYITP